MRNHQQIIDATGPTALARALDISVDRVKQWRRQKSIPGPYWKALEDARLATLEELAEDAQRRIPAAKQSDPVAPRAEASPG